MMRRLLLALLAFTLAMPLLATEPNPSARQRELIDKLFAAMNIQKQTHDMIDAMYKQIGQQYLDRAAANGNDADDIEEAKELFGAFREKASRIDFGGELLDAYAHIYGKYFNEEELTQLIAFYAAPVGRKVLAVTPQLTEEGMQAGMQHLYPKIEQAMQEAANDVEKKRPWRKTIADMRSVSAALTAWSIDNDDKYPDGDYSALKEKLVPAYIKALPEKDMWNHDYAYVVSDDRAHFRLVSAGADSNFEWDSRRIVAAKSDADEDADALPTVYRERLEDDLILADGSFLQLPVQAKGK
ncbi:MAG TPA: DUF2059 domain-containing protein [Thermoanaerobaculia bacterium]|nr:DUF2059 domain-containing protein [Thermoanaerobaculia bacterium]